MGLKISKGDWFRSGLEIVAMPSQVKITNRIDGATYEEAIANAKLVEASPEMLKLLIKILDKINNMEDAWWIDCPDKGGFDTDEIEKLINQITKE
jgi:hypothetical protein